MLKCSCFCPVSKEKNILFNPIIISWLALFRVSNFECVPSMNSKTWS